MLGSLRKRLASFRRPDGPEPHEPPGVGDPAPERPRLAAGEPRVVLFLRHTGCAFGERMLAELRATARDNPDIEFLAVTHGAPDDATAWCEELGLERVAVSNPDANATDQWCRDPGADNLRVLVDEGRELYAEWGLGLGGLGHLLRPAVVRNLVRVLRSGAKDRTPSGTRWQRAGMFGVDPDGTVRVRYVADYAGDLPDVSVAPSFLDRESETSTATVRNVTDEAAAEADPVTTDDRPAPRVVDRDTEPAVSRVPEPRTVPSRATAAVRRVEAGESVDETDSDAEAETTESERQRLRTDGG